ncbi:hypothetical protein [Crateriforma spongiae]|uniref:hypothetical protein n=1 Tax=Crateriforma spongiae TaxID=2724528 RepID=UPI0014473638|nr:hypothetical protein [Crateriforma spongiae]
MAVTFEILPGGDADYLRILRRISESEVAKELGIKGLKIDFAGDILPECKLESFEEIGDHVLIPQLLEINGNAIKALRWGTDALHIQIHRQFDYGAGKQPRNPTISLNVQDRKTRRPDQLPLLVAVIQNACGEFNPSNVDSILDQDQREHFDAREKALLRLESLQASLIENLEKAKAKHYEEAIAERQKIAQELEQSRVEIEGERNAVRQQLEKDRADFERLKADFDDRTNTHVRRQLSSDLEKMLATRISSFSLSKETRNRFWAVGGFFLVLIVAFGTLAGYLLFQERSETEGLDYFLASRQVASTVGFFLSIGFFIRWLNNWAQQHADEELRLMRLEVDLQRANWLVELMFEWDETKANEIPESLLRTMSANLFTESERRDDTVLTPSDAIVRTLAGLPNSSAELEFPGWRIALNRKAMKELRKQSGSGGD